MIYYFTPFDTDKNIGRAHNQHCALVPNSEDWICIRDADTTFLLPDFGNLIEDVIRAHGEKYALFGCLTNRLRGEHQLYNGVFSNNGIIPDHIEIAKGCAQNHRLEVKETDKPIAGMFMLFQKKTWELAEGFAEDSIYFDKIFSIRLRQLGLKKAVMQGLYIWHNYRLGSDNPLTDIGHLLKH